MSVFFFYLIVINIIEFSCQLVFTSLKMPNRNNQMLSSSSLNAQHQSQSLINPYNHPYYHIALNDSDSIPDEQRLMAQLLRNYDPSARPVYNASNTVTVAFGIALAQLSDMVCDHEIH